MPLNVDLLNAIMYNVGLLNAIMYNVGLLNAIMKLSSLPYDQFCKTFFYHAIIDAPSQ
jgi:hypothetical protein